MSMAEKIYNSLKKLNNSIETVIYGKSETIELVLTGLIAGGHVLLEDYPGSGKTTLAKALGQAIDCSSSESIEHIVDFRRIQFTPDLLPSDVLGVNVFEPKSATFNFQRGPIFAHIVLADEINRTGPKVQAAFLECMAERQVTIDNTTHKLDELFFVIGTQNPLDLAGTYPLPLVQLDRFILKIPMSYVDEATEISILKNSASIKSASDSMSPAISREDILSAKKMCDSIHFEDKLIESIAKIVQETRNNNLLQFGASTRAALMLKRAMSARAVLQERDFATDNDLKILAEPVLLHRLKFHQGAGDPKEAFASMIAPIIENLS